MTGTTITKQTDRNVFILSGARIEKLATHNAQMAHNTTFTLRFETRIVYRKVYLIANNLSNVNIAMTATRDVITQVDAKLENLLCSVTPITTTIQVNRLLHETGIMRILKFKIIRF